MNNTTQDDWDSHWSKFASAAEQNPANVLRMDAVFDRLGLSGGGEGARVLDLGCGQGEVLGVLSRRFPGAGLMGVDLSAEGVAKARARLPQAQLTCANLLQPVDLGAFKTLATHAVCSEVLEHLDDPSALLRHARVWLEPGARLVITVPAGPMSAFDKHIGHRRHFTAKSLREVIEAAGYRAVEVSRPGFPFFNLYRLTVIARGQGLVKDVGQAGELPFAARAAMKGFGVLFRLNADRLNLGWQLVAVAEAPH